jgi:ornithine cyclodeaminase
MLGKRELATDVLERSDVLMCDSVEVSSSVGELQHAAHLRERAVDFGAVLNGTANGRTSDEQITVADLCGLGIQDAAIAGLVMTSLTDLEQ